MADDCRGASAMRQAFARVHPTPRQFSSRRDAPALPSSRRDCAARKEPHVARRGLPNTYLRLRQLGKGGFARVYEMLDKTTGKNVAVKVVQKAHVKKANAEAKLRSEIQIHKSLEHSSVVRFLQSYEDADNAYLILELCPNQTLSEYLRAKPRRVISSPEAVYFAKDLLAGLFYLRENMIIHRDLKLSNLFLDAEFHLKIGDFGLAAQLKDSHDVRHTLCGTPNYIAPEILDVKAGHSFEVDLWSFGVIVYTLLVGRPPFETNNLRTTYRRIRQMDYSFPDTVPTDAKEMIVGVLQSNVNVRWTLDDILHCAWMDQPCAPPNVPGITTTFSSAASLERDLPRATNRPASVEPRSSRAHRPANKFRPVSTAPRRIAPSANAPRTPTTSPGQPRGTTTGNIPPRVRDTSPINVPLNRATTGSVPTRARVTPRGGIYSGGSGPTPRASARSTTHSKRDGTPVRSKSRDVSPRVVAFQLYDAHMLQHKINPTARGVTKVATPRMSTVPASGQCQETHHVSQRGAYVKEMRGDKKKEHATGVTHDIRCFFTRATPGSHQIVRSATMNQAHGTRDQRAATYSRPLSARLLQQSVSPHGRPHVSPKHAPSSAHVNKKRAENQAIYQSTASSTRASSSHASQYRASVLAQKRRDNSISRATSGRTDISPSPSRAHLTSCAFQDDAHPPQSEGATASTQHHSDMGAKQISNASLRSLRPAECAMTSASQNSAMGAKQVSDASLRSVRLVEATRSSTTRTFGRQGSLESVSVEPLRLDKIIGDLRTMGPDTRTTEAVRALETVRIHQVPSCSSSHIPTTVVTSVTSGESRKYQSRACAITNTTTQHAADEGAMSCACPNPPLTPVAQEQCLATSTTRPRPMTLRSPGKNAVVPSRHLMLADSIPTTPTRTPLTKLASKRPQNGSTPTLSGAPRNDATWAHEAQRVTLTPTDVVRQPRLNENVGIAARPLREQAYPQVVKWVDYSSKYGLATLMSDYSINVQFNDKTHVIASSSENVTKFHYIARNQKTSDVHSTYLFSSHPKELQKKVTLFAYFRSTLLAPAPVDDKFNLEGRSSLPICRDDHQSSSLARTEDLKLMRKFVATPQNAQSTCRRKQMWSTDECGPDMETTQMPYVQRWLKNGQAMMFVLSNRSVQVVFSDKTELLLDEERKLLRYVNARRKYRVYHIDEGLENPELKQRVIYTRNLISLSA